MLHLCWKRIGYICAATIFLISEPLACGENPEAMATAHRWVAAKFLGEVMPNPPKAICWFTSGPGR